MHASTRYLVKGMRAEGAKRTGVVWKQHRISQHRMPHPPAKLHPPTPPASNHATSADGQRRHNITTNRAHDATAHAPGEGCARICEADASERLAPSEEPGSAMNQAHLRKPTNWHNTTNDHMPLPHRRMRQITGAAWGGSWVPCLQPSFHISMHEPPDATNAAHILKSE